MADVVESVSKRLDVLRVGEDRHVALRQVTKVILQGECTRRLVVTKQTFDFAPYGVGRGARLDDGLQDLVGDGGIEEHTA